MQYETIIGIEVHCELTATHTKMFSGSPVDFAQVPNSCTNEIDLAHPGTLPALNRQAVRDAVMVAGALHMALATTLYFDRKNYHYSDLPKGFQITQQFHPLGRQGYLDIQVDDQIRHIRINRLHMEEDTAKQFHEQDRTLIDFNRAGVPLIEIVSEPDIRSGQEAAEYIRVLRETILYLGVSDVKMEEGSMRCDINVSVRPQGTDVLGTKVEIKNLNSIANIRTAIDYEVNRQISLYEQGGQVFQETRRFDETTKTTELMRRKEGAVDYQYFPEPNIPPIWLGEAYLQAILDTLPELPQARRARYLQDYGLSTYDADQLIANKALSDYFDQAVSLTDDPKTLVNWLLGAFSAQLNKQPVDDLLGWISPQAMADLIAVINRKEISTKQAKEVFEAMVQGAQPLDIIKKRGMRQVSDESQLVAWIDAVLADNPQVIEDFKAGKDRSVKFVVGQVMKQSKGQADPRRTNELVLARLREA